MQLTKRAEQMFGDLIIHYILFQCFPSEGVTRPSSITFERLIGLGDMNFRGFFTRQ